MKVAITGGTGFVGAHSARAMLDAGHELRLLVHPDDRLDDALAAVGIDATDHEIVVGDVRTETAIERLLAGADALMHAAGIVAVDDRQESLMWEINVDATARILARAVTLGLDPILHVASYITMFPSTDPMIGPDSPTAPGRSAYGRTKATADRIARAFQSAGAPVVITYPASIVGPAAGSHRGISASGWGPILTMGMAPSFTGGMAMIDVRDVADLHAAIMRSGQGPRRLVCGGEMLDFDEIIDVLETTAGRPIRRIPLRPGMVRGLGRMSDAMGRLVPLSAGLSFEAAWLMTAATPTDDRAALQLLGRPWRSAREALAASVDGVLPQ